jgi:hypothetical protein
VYRSSGQKAAEERPESRSSIAKTLRRVSMHALAFFGVEAAQQEIQTERSQQSEISLTETSPATSATPSAAASAAGTGGASADAPPQRSSLTKSTPLMFVAPVAVRDSDLNGENSQGNQSKAHSRQTSNDSQEGDDRMSPAPAVMTEEEKAARDERKRRIKEFRNRFDIPSVHESIRLDEDEARRRREQRAREVAERLAKYVHNSIRVHVCLCVCVCVCV